MSIENNKVLYEELVKMRNNGELIPTQFYHITDYVTTTTQEDTRSAQHAFDIVVIALDEYHLYEEARIIPHHDDEYFKGSKLTAWKVWYSLDNDKGRFVWADPNGKGVIYRMIDEYGNDCPYDFTNIQFKYSKEWLDEHPNWCRYVLGEIPSDDIYLYTFSYVCEDMSVKDLSIIGNTLKNDNGGITGVHDNIIGACGWSETKSIYKLGGNVFVASEYWDGKKFNGLYGNILRANCERNIFGNECNYNVLKGGCSHNVFGNYCESNKLYQNCINNIFKTSSHSNQLGCNCSNIVLNDSSHNMFGAECDNIVTGYNFHCNTFGTYCRNIVIGDEEELMDNVKFNIFENNVRNIYFHSSDKTYKKPLQNITVCQGVRGEKDCYKNIIIDTMGQHYQLKVAHDSNNELKVYCPAD